MIAPFPPDRRLPGLPAALDEQSMIELVAAHLPDCLSGELMVLGCRPEYVRYKPETRCLIQYDLTLANEAGKQQALSAHVSVFRDQRAHRRWASGRMQRLMARTAKHHPGLPHQRTAHVAELRALLQLYPLDYDLPHLVYAADQRRMTKVLRASVPAGGTVSAVVPPELLRYKPERKALLRYPLQGGPADALYSKLHTDHRGEWLVPATESLIAAGVDTPRVLLHHPRLRLIAHEAAAGTQMASLRGSAGHAGWMEPLSEALARFQSVNVAGLPVHTSSDEAAAIQLTAEWLSQIAPSLAPRLTRLGDTIIARLADVPILMATVHGDFYDDQAIVSDSGVVLLDLDELRRAHPLLDVGNMLAHLTAAPDDLSVSREAFLAAIRDQGHEPAELALFEAIGLLKLAPGPFRRLEPNWPERVEQIVALAERRLAEGERTTSGAPNAGTHGDSTPRSSRLETVRPDSDLSAAQPIPPVAKADGLSPDKPADAGSIGDHRGAACRSPDLRYRDAGEEQALPLRQSTDGRQSRTAPPTSHDPNDAALPQLAALLDPDRMGAELSTSFGGPAIEIQAIELVRHKVGRRAIVRYDFARDGSSERLYGKTFASERGPRVHAVTRAITIARAFGPAVELPDPLAWLPHQKLLLQGAVAGRSVETALLAGDRSLAARIATSLHRLHSCDLELGRTHDLSRELAPLPGRAAQVTTQCLELGRLAARCLETVGWDATRDWPWRSRPVHRDFYHDQLLIDGEKLAVLDLDDAAMSEPAVDVANFAAHLRLLGIQKPDHAGALAEVERTFVERYRDLDPALDPELLRFLTAATLLRVAGIHVSRAAGPEVARGLLEASCLLLGQRGASAAGPINLHPT